jgi:hypothetical protein
MPRLPDEVAGALDGAYSSDSLRRVPQPKTEEEKEKEQEQAEEKDRVEE